MLVGALVRIRGRQERGDGQESRLVILDSDFDFSVLVQVQTLARQLILLAKYSSLVKDQARRQAH